MNHLIKKFKVAGAGGSKPKPQPASLKPPKLGVHQLGSSYSYAEILDLISDGPIAGLVNQNNSRVNGLAALQGIYMDDIPIAVTDDQSAQVSTVPFYDTTNISNTISELGDSIKQTTVVDATSSRAKAQFDGFRIFSRTINSFSYLFPVNWRLQFKTNSIAYKAIYNNITFFHPTGIKIKGEGKAYIPTNITSDLIRIVNDNSGYVAARKSFHVLFGGFFYTSSYEREYINSIFPNKPEDMSLTLYVTNKIEKITQRSEDLDKRGQESNYDTVSALYVDVSNIVFDSSQNPQAFIDENGKVRTYMTLDIDAPDGFEIAETLNFYYPSLDRNGNWNGRMRGFIVYFLRTKFIGLSKYFDVFIDGEDAQSLFNVENFKIGVKSNSTSSQKYNYTNILSEIKTGEEKQKPFKYFNNVYIDKTYDSRLLGPFRKSGQIQRLFTNNNVMGSNFTLSSGGQKGLPSDEGSTDERNVPNNKTRNYSDWDKNAISFDEEAISSTHFVENPNTESVIVSLGVEALHDTAHRDIDSKPKIDAGSRFPGVVNIEIEIGKVNEKGVKTTHYKKRYQIIALVESPMTIDIGNPDSKDFESSSYKFIKDIDKDSIESGVFEPLKLPSAFDVSGPEETPTRRYVKVTKLSTETNSILTQKVVSLQKVTEIIPVNCSYPFSSIIGTKLDARTFSSIPTRTFDARLKLIKIPSNYYPVKGNDLETDKRYYTSVVDYENATTKDKSVYIGDWNGLFKIGWTDNPAWVLYDLLTNNRYGLGQYIDEEDINKWDLYKIGRFCDSVDEDGNFVGVPDGRGGLEPRYSCNIMFTEGTKVFDCINQIANLFRGSVFYNNNEINFLDDRLREPTALFSNSNVKDGLFSYSNYRRDEQFNAVEVIYIDRFDNFKTKVEYVEDEEDILQRGMFKKQVNAYGVTSKAMANRIARHLIYQTIKENQSISFIGGNEVLLCKPGDLIIIEDELKSLKSNFGRVLDVDPSAKTIRIDESFVTGEYTSGITLYCPTGLESETSLATAPQIITLSITGAVNQDYGSLLYVDSTDINANLLSFVSDGSAYRIQRQNSNDQIYKILEMREEAPNEYAVVATKYDTGKFDLIENSVSVEFQSDTLAYASNIQINDVNYVTLDTPIINSVVTGSGSDEGYYISGNWQSVPNATGYTVILYDPSMDSQSTRTSETGLSFDNNTNIGKYLYVVEAIGDTSKNAGIRYYNSLTANSGISILPTNSTLYTTDNAVVNNITIQ